MSILSESYEPETDTGEDLLAHSGEEGGVVEGELKLTVAGQTWVLGARCCLLFRQPAAASFQEHRQGACPNRQRQHTPNDITSIFENNKLQHAYISIKYRKYSFTQR
jgi:hypothetical protein